MLESNLELSKIKDGGLQQVFEVELEKVMDNITDINTNTKAREINIKLKFTPNMDRDNAVLSFEVKSKLSPYQEQDTQVYVGTEKGKTYALEHEKGVIKGQVALTDTNEQGEEQTGQEMQNKQENKKDQKIISL